MVEEAYVTLITNESYYHGAITLGISLSKTRTKRLKVVLVSPNVPNHLRSKLSCIWDQVIQVEVLDSHDLNNLSLIGRPELGVTFSKLHIWELVQFKKCVFLDADTLVLQNIDELFQRSELSAAPDTGWPDCFNSGVFVFTPSLETYDGLIELAKQVGSFDGADQGLLNTYWGNWANEHEKRLSFTFNVGINTSYFYNAAILKFKHSIKVLHYLGTSKPWLLPFYSSADERSGLPQNVNTEFYAKWWQYYNEKEGYFQALEPKCKPHETSEKSPVDSHGSGEETEMDPGAHTGPLSPPIEPPATLGTDKPSEPPPSETSVTERHDDVIITMPETEATPPASSAPEAASETTEPLRAEDLDAMRIEGPGEEEKVVDERKWQLDWQKGHMEYMGRDASDLIIQNLMKRLK